MGDIVYARKVGMHGPSQQPVSAKVAYEPQGDVACEFTAGNPNGYDARSGEHISFEMSAGDALVLARSLKRAALEALDTPEAKEIR